MMRMTGFHQRAMMRVTIAVLVAGAYYLTILAPVVSATSPVRAAAEYVADSDDATFHSMLSNIGQIPTGYRAAVVQRASPAERAEAWTRNLDRFVSGHPNATEAQLEAIRHFRAFLVPEHFVNSPTEETRKQTDAAVAELSALFGRADVAVLIGHGQPESTVGMPPRERIAYYLRTNAGKAWVSVVTLAWVSSAVSAMSPNCSCSSQSNLCGWPYGSIQDCNLYNDDQCNGSPSGCGSFWQYPCDGFCYNPF